MRLSFKVLENENSSLRKRLTSHSPTIAVAYFTAEDATLTAVSWALFRDLQSKGIQEDIGRIQGQLQKFVHKKKRNSKVTERLYNVMDFNLCDIVALRKLEDSEIRYADFQLLIQCVKDNNSDRDHVLNYSFQYEHVLVSGKDCMRVISEQDKNGKRHFLCRSNNEVGIPREERLPVIDVNSVDLLYRVDAVEV